MIYMDHAATTPLAPQVLEAMLPWLKNQYGNASAVYGLGQQAKRMVEESRKTAAAFLNAAPAEIYFTSGGSESDNWALIGAAEAYQEKGRHIITTKMEHHAVLNTCAYLERRGFSVSYLDVDREGFVQPETLLAALRPDTILVSVMAANNEVGSIQPLRELAALAHAHGALFHTDAVQAFGHIPLDAGADGFDLLSASAHKLNGPKGVGLLYIRKGLALEAFMHGGQQERGRRAGTENTAGIAGFAEAIRLADAKMQVRAKREAALSRKLFSLIKQALPDTELNGAALAKGRCELSGQAALEQAEEKAGLEALRRLPNNLNLRFPNVDAEALLLRLAGQGLCASSGSACASGSLDASHVLLAMGRSKKEAKESLRLSLGEGVSEAEISEAAALLCAAVSRLREMKKTTR